MKARSLQAFWSELQWNTERTKYLNAVPNPRFRTSYIQTDRDKPVSLHDMETSLYISEGVVIII